jgi:hypothetical protein
MRRSLRATAVSALALTGVVLWSTGGGATTPGGNDTVTANGGFVSLSALNLLGLTGAGSSASSNNHGVQASGTGLCATDAEGSAATCQAASSSVTNAAATPAAPNATAGPTCLVPTLPVVVVNLAAACGTASVSQDPTGAQTAKGVGSLGQLTVGLGSLVSPSLLSSLPRCGSTTSPGSAFTLSVGGLLGSVNTLLSTSGLPLLATSTGSTGSPLDSVCSILSGLSSELGGLGGVLSNLTASSDLLTIKPGQATSTISTTQSASGDSLETATATAEGVEVDVLGLLDVQLSPNAASITIDTTTGAVSAPGATTGVLSVTPVGSAGTGLSVPDLSGLISSLLGALGASTVVDPTLTTVAQSTTSVAPDGQSGSADAADLKLDLLNGMVVLNLGGATVTAANVSPPPVTQAAVTPGPPVSPVVPGVTTVHTGEFWAGPLPLVLAPAMALTGLVLIGRRRVRAATRALLPHLARSRVR